MQHLSRLVFFIVFAALAGSASGQKTLTYEDVIRHYNRGLDLYDKEKYGPAIQEFKTFISLNNDKLLHSMARYYWGASALELNNPEGLTIMKEFIELYPESHRISEAHFKVASYYLRQKEYRQALRHYKEVDVNLLNKADAEACYFGRGYCYYQTDKYEDAKKDLKPLLTNEQGKYYTQANYYYGYICYRENNYDEALTCFERIKNREIRIVKLYIAQIHYARGSYSKVIDFRDSLEFEPARKPGRFLVGKSYYQLTQYEKALPYMREMENNTDSLLSSEIYQVGYTFFANKKYTEAYLTFSKIASENTALGQMASYNLAESFIELDKKSSARNAFYQASRVDFDKTVQEIAAFNYAKLSFELSYQQEALSSLRNFIEQYKESEYNDDAKGLLAELLLSTKNYKEAVPVLETIKKMNDQAKGAYQKITYYRGEELYLNKEFDAALNHFNKSLTYTPDRSLQAMSHFWLGEISYKKGDYNKAIDHYSKFLDARESEKSKFRSLAYYNLGYCYFKKTQYDNALNYFSKFVTLGSDKQDIYVDAQLRLADCHYISRQYEKALDVYSYVTAKEAAGSDYAHFQRASIYGLMGQHTQKISELKKITEKHPNSIYTDDAIFELGNVYQQLEYYNDAIRYFNYLISDFGNTSPHVKESWAKLGLIYLAMNNKDMALESFKKVVELYPETDEAKQALEGVQAIYAERGEADVYIEYLNSLKLPSMSAMEQDSFLYTTAFNRYGKVDCKASVSEFEKYLKQFAGGLYAVNAHYYKAECEFKLKDYDKALIDYQFVVTQPPGDFSERSARQIATIYYIRKEYANALPYYEMLENISRSKDNYQTAVIGEMKCLQRLNRLDDAHIAAIKVLRSDYTNKEVLSEARFIMGKYDLSRNSLDSAMGNFQYVAKGNNNVLGAEATYYIASIQFAKGDYDATEKTVLEINDKFSAYEYWVAKAFILMSDVFVKRNDAFNARAILQNVLDNYDRDDDDIKNTAREKLKLIQ